MIQQRLQKMSFSPKLLSNSVLSYTPKKCQKRVQITIFIPKLWMQKKGYQTGVLVGESVSTHVKYITVYATILFSSMQLCGYELHQQVG